MRETKGDLFQTIGIYDAMCITTNGTVRKDGGCVMGRGCALEATQHWPNVQQYLGQQIKLHGNHVYHIHTEIRGELKQDVFSFPVKTFFRGKADINLIKRSCRELLDITDERGYNSVVIPRPGCGYGYLTWQDVRNEIEYLLDDRFYIITF